MGTGFSTAKKVLVLLRGQWVEVDRDKLTEALDHWKQVEKQAAGGLSFIDGMRLLAGAPMDLSEESQQDTRASRNGPLSMPARGWPTFSETCGVLRTSGTPDPAPTCKRLSATIKRQA